MDTNDINIDDDYLYNQSHNSKNPDWVKFKCKTINDIEGVGTFYDNHHHIWCKLLKTNTNGTTKKKLKLSVSLKHLMRIIKLKYWK